MRNCSPNDSFSVFDLAKFAPQEAWLWHSVDFDVVPHVISSRVEYNILTTSTVTEIAFDAAASLSVDAEAEIIIGKEDSQVVEVVHVQHVHAEEAAIVRLGQPVPPGTPLKLRMRSKTTDDTPSEALPWADQPQCVYPFCFPTNARNLFPAVDRIDHAMPYHVTIEVAENLMAFSAGKLTATSIGEGRRTFTFEVGRQIAYLHSFVAGDLDKIEVDGVEVVFPRGRSQKDVKAAAARFAGFLQRVCDEFGVQPIHLIVAFLPGFPYSGMECLLVYLSEDQIAALGKQETTVLHEILHLVAFGGSESLVGVSFRDAAPLHEAFTSYYEMKLSDDNLKAARLLEASRTAEGADWSRSIVNDPMNPASIGNELFSQGRAYKGAALRLRNVALIVGEAFHERAREFVQANARTHVRFMELMLYCTRDWPKEGAPDRARTIDHLFYRPGWTSLHACLKNDKLEVKDKNNREVYSVVPIRWFGENGFVEDSVILFNGETMKLVDIPDRASGVLLDPEVHVAASIESDLPERAWVDAAAVGNPGIRGLAELVLHVPTVVLGDMARRKWELSMHAIIEGTLALREGRPLRPILETLGELAGAGSLVGQGLALTSFYAAWRGRNGDGFEADDTIMEAVVAAVELAGACYDLLTIAAQVLQSIPGRLPARAAYAAGCAWAMTSRNRAVKPFGKCLLRVEQEHDDAVIDALTILVIRPRHLTTLTQVASVLQGNQRILALSRRIQVNKADERWRLEKFIELLQ